MRWHADVLHRAHPARRPHDRAARLRSPVPAPTPSTAMSKPNAQIPETSPASPHFGYAWAERAQETRKWRPCGGRQPSSFLQQPACSVQTILFVLVRPIPALARSHFASPQSMRPSNFRSGSVIPLPPRRGLPGLSLSKDSNRDVGRSIPSHPLALPVPSQPTSL